MPLKIYTMILMLFVGSSSVSAQSLEVQPALQAALFKKIIAMSVGVGSERNSVLVVFDNQYQGDTEVIADALEELGINLVISRSGALPENLANIAAAYVSNPSESVLEGLAQKGILSLSGYRDVVSSGKASLSIVNEGGKPKPIINKTRLQTEGQNKLLTTLAKVALIVE